MAQIDELIDDINERETRFPGHWDFEKKYDDKTIVKLLTDFGYANLNDNND